MNIIKTYIQQRKAEKQIGKLLCKRYKVLISKNQVDILQYCAEQGINSISDLIKLTK